MTVSYSVSNPSKVYLCYCYATHPSVFHSTKMNHLRPRSTRIFKRLQVANILPYSASSRSSHSNAKPGTTIDDHDVERYSHLNKIWWDVSGPVQVLHAMNEIRVPFVRDGLMNSSDRRDPEKPLINLKLLDIGCGGGILTEELAKIGAEVIGIDANKDMIKVAKDHSQTNTKLISKPTYFHTTIEDHAHDYKNYYDGVVASEIIEHVSDPALFVKASVDVLKPGGRIFFTTPNRTLTSRVLYIWIAEYVLQAIPKGTHEYHKFVRPNELAVMLEKNNCQLNSVRGFKLHLLQKKLTFVNSLRFMYAVQATKVE